MINTGVDLILIIIFFLVHWLIEMANVHNFPTKCWIIIHRHPPLAKNKTSILVMLLPTYIPGMLTKQYQQNCTIFAHLCLLHVKTMWSILSRIQKAEKALSGARVTLSDGRQTGTIHTLVIGRGWTSITRQHLFVHILTKDWTGDSTTLLIREM